MKIPQNNIDKEIIEEEKVEETPGQIFTERVLETDRLDSGNTTECTFKKKTRVSNVRKPAS